MAVYAMISEPITSRPADGNFVVDDTGIVWSPAAMPAVNVVTAGSWPSRTRSPTARPPDASTTTACEPGIVFSMMFVRVADSVPSATTQA